jgi:hypothetical protein
MSSTNDRPWSELPSRAPPNRPQKRWPSLLVYCFSYGVMRPLRSNSSSARRVRGIHSGGVSWSQRSRPASTSSRL